MGIHHPLSGCVGTNRKVGLRVSDLLDLSKKRSRFVKMPMKVAYWEPLSGLKETLVALPVFAGCPSSHDYRVEDSEVRFAG